MFPECVSNGIFAHYFSKSPSFGVFFGKNWFFSKKEVSKVLNVKKSSQKRLKWYYCLRILKTFNILWLFAVKKWFFSIKNLECFKIAICVNCSANASQMVFLLRKSETFKLCNFLEKIWVFPKMSLELFQDG